MGMPWPLIPSHTDDLEATVRHRAYFSVHSTVVEKKARHRSEAFSALFYGQARGVIPAG